MWETGREAFLTVRVFAPSGRQSEIEAAVDTGFTGSLCLGAEEISSLNLPFVGKGAAVLADGGVVETRYHRGRILWHGRERGIQILSVEVEPGGEVMIEERAERG